MITQEQLRLLTVAANRFWMDKDLDPSVPDIPDSEWDKLAKAYESETGISVKNLVQWDSDLRIPHESTESLSKIIVENKDMISKITEIMSNLGDDCVAELKYDGSSIKAYYDETGRLRKVVGTPDTTVGIDRTKAFFRIFPHQVKSGIKSIQGEVLVDCNKFGKLSRNKANGITNSKHQDDEVEAEAFVRAYRISYHDNRPYNFEETQKDLDELPEVILNGKVVFQRAYKLTPDLIPDTDIVHLPNGDNVQADGVVIYSKSGIQGYKLYYTESAITTVKTVQWQFNSDNGSFSPVLIVDTVELNGKSINKVSANGTPNLIASKMGKGAKVRIILANMTIPKVHEVIETSEDYEFPVCKCGKQTAGNPENIFGAAIKCLNPWCEDRVERTLLRIKGRLRDYAIPDVEEAIIYDRLFIMELMAIDRYNPNRSCKVTQSEYPDKFGLILLAAIKSENWNKFHDTLLAAFNFTELTRRLFTIYSYATFRALVAILKFKRI